MSQESTSGNTDELREQFQRAISELREAGAGWDDIDRLYESTKRECDGVDPKSHRRSRQGMYQVDHLREFVQSLNGEIDTLHQDLTEDLRYEKRTRREEIERLDRRIDLLEQED